MKEKNLKKILKKAIATNVAVLTLLGGAGVNAMNVFANGNNSQTTVATTQQQKQTIVNWTIFAEDNDDFMAQGQYVDPNPNGSGDTFFTIDMIAEDYELAQGETGRRVVKIGETGSVIFKVKDSAKSKPAKTVVNWTFDDENGSVKQGTYVSEPTSLVGDTSFSVDMTDGIPDGYELAKDETGYATVKYGRANTVSFKVVKKAPEKHTTVVNWTIMGDDDFIRQGTYKFDPTTEVGDIFFTIDMIGGIPEGYELSKDETGSRVIKIGDETAITFNVDKKPVEEHTTVVNWAIFGDDGLVMTGVYTSDPTTEVGDTFFTIDMIGGIPEGYELSKDETGSRVIKIGETTAITFNVDKKPVEKHTTVVNWTIMGDDDFIKQGTYEFEPTTEVGDTFFTIDMIGGIPEGYELSKDETGSRVIKIGETTAITFNVDKKPVEKHTTVVNWTIMGDDDFIKQGTYEFEPTTEVGDTFFTIDMIGGIPEGYELSKDETGSRVIKIGETTAITFNVDKKPVEEHTTVVNWTIMGDDGLVLTGTYTSEPTTFVGDTFFTIDMIGGIPEGYELSEDETGSRVVKIGETADVTFLVNKIKNNDDKNETEDPVVIPGDTTQDDNKGETVKTENKKDTPKTGDEVNFTFLSMAALAVFGIGATVALKKKEN